MKSPIIQQKNVKRLLIGLFLAAWMASCDMAIISIWDVPNIVSTGDTFTVSMTVENVDPGNYGRPAKLRYYLSLDTHVGIDDILLAEDTTLEHAHYLKQHTDTQQVTIPDNIPTGKYFFLYSVDDQLGTIDLNLRNNTVAKSINVIGQQPTGIDLTFYNFSRPRTNTVAGDDFTLQYAIKNIGSETAATSLVKYYISDNGTLDTNEDMFLGELDVPAIGPNLSQSVNHKVHLPINLWEGSYYLFALLDAGNEILETEEFNNIIYRKLFLFNQFDPPQLVRNPNAGNAIAGNATHVSFDFKNTRERNYENMSAGFVLSKDRQLSMDDQWLGHSTTGAMTAGSIRQKTKSIDIPEDVLPGEYWLLFVTSEELPGYARYPDRQPPATRIHIEHPAETTLPSFLNPVAEKEKKDDRFSISQTPSGIHLINYFLLEESELNIRLVDASGRIIGELFSGFQTVGNHSLNIEKTGLGNGIYFIHIDYSENGNKKQEVQKMVVVK